MKKLITLLCTWILLLSTPVSASSWHQTNTDDGQTTYIDTDSIRYARNASGNIDQNIILYWTKTQYTHSLFSKELPGGTMLSYCAINVANRTKSVFSYTYKDNCGSSAGSDTSGGTPLSADKDKQIKADYDFMIQYCKENDAAITKATKDNPAAVVENQPAPEPAPSAPTSIGNGETI